jgi:NitT/TauT family transport system substrate-binding protein
MTRGSLLAGLAGAAVAGPVAAATLTPIHVAAALSESSANAYYAHELGFFRQHGLDATVELFASSGAFSGAVVSGAFDVGGVDTGTLITAHARGVPFVVLCNGGTYSAEAPNTMLCTAKDAPIRSAPDFEGKTIGVTTLNNVNQIGLIAWLANGGANYHAVNMIEVPSSAMAVALTSGRIAGALVGEPYLTQSADVLHALAGVGSAIAQQFMLAAWATSRTWLTSNPDAARNFAAAINQASAWAIANPNRANEIFATYVKMPIALAQHIHHVAWTTAPPARLIQPVIDAYAKYGGLAQTFSATELL